MSNEDTDIISQEEYDALSVEEQQEYEQVDELKKSTIADYINKAVDNVASRTHDQAKAPNILSKDPEYIDRYQKFHNKTKKRKEMIGKAVDRLSKEELEQVDELKKSTIADYIKKQ
jgi:hypothetical protein